MCGRKTSTLMVLVALVAPRIDWNAVYEAQKPTRAACRTYCDSAMGLCDPETTPARVRHCKQAMLAGCLAFGLGFCQVD